MSSVRNAFTLVALLGAAACGGGADGGTNTPPPPPPPPTVATVVVTLANSTIAPGSGTVATALVRDASGNTLTGRAVNWSTSNPGVATVNTTGAVTAVSGGSATITATSEGKSGGATLAVSSPVTQVTISGTSRVKVGDTYQYTAEARLADNTLVQRPVTWTVVEPGKGTITQAGVLTPLATGAITVRATVENVFFNGAVTGYDWQFVSGATIMGAILPADLLVTNKLGQSEYPELAIVCSANGTFSLWVDTDNFITANGIVAFSFDGGAATAQNWIEFDNFSALGHPGTTNASRKNMAIAIAGSRLFTFAFGEFLSVTRIAQFRVTGLGPHLATLLNGCPSNAIMSGIAAENTESFWERVPSELLRATPMDAVRQLRLDRGPAGDADRTIPSVPAAIDPSRLQSRP